CRWLQHRRVRRPRFRCDGGVCRCCSPCVPRVMADEDQAAQHIIDLYERHAGDYDRDRGRGSMEHPWLDRAIALMPSAGAVLDIGCGMAEPIASYLVNCGFTVTGIDSSSSMIALCRARFPDHQW